MIQILNYYSRFQDSRQSFAGLPAWGRFLIGVAAIPGIVLAGLSILALGISILALLLLTIPVYRVVRWISSFGGGPTQRVVVEPEPGVIVEQSGEIMDEAPPAEEPTDRPRRQIEVTIIE